MDECAEWYDSPAMAAARDRTIALLITLLMVISAGCSRGEAPSTPTAQLGTPAAEESTPEATEAQPTEPSPPADPYAIPADPNDIDKQYVEKVLEALSAGYVEATRQIAAAGAVSATARKALDESHTEEAARSVVRDFKLVLKQANGAHVFRASPAPARVTVKRVISARRDCVFALAQQDLSGLFKAETRPVVSYYYLIAGNSEEGGLNPTPWKIAGNVQSGGAGRGYEDPCGSGT